MSSPASFAGAVLRNGARAIAIAALESIAARDPKLLADGVPATFANPVEDTRTRLLVLAETLDVDRPELFADHIAWSKVALAHRGVTADYLLQNLLALGDSARAALPPHVHAAVEPHLAAALHAARTAPTEIPSCLEGDGPLRDEARRFVFAILENRRDHAIGIVLAAHRAGSSIPDLHDHVLAVAQRELGRMWLMAEVPIADEHFASRVVESCLDRLEALREPSPRGAQTVLTCSVSGDLHAIGVRMVADRFHANGFNAWNLGPDVPAADLEWTLTDRRVDLIALGATLVLNLGSLRTTIEHLRRTLGSACPPLLVGGRPFTVAPGLHVALGADAAAVDPASAVARGRELIAC